jgi:hypothetical protein
MKNKYLIIIFIILLLFVFLLFFYFNNKDNKINNINESFIDLNNNEKSINYNLIIGGNFNDNKNPLNFVNESGKNKLVTLKNPSISQYVLKQEKSNELTFYELKCDNQKNSKYILLFWLCITDNNQKSIDINEIDLEKLVKVKIQNNDLTNHVPRLNYNVIQKTNISNNKWFLIKYEFLSGTSNSNYMNIFLNYTDKLIFDNYYFSDISLYRVLIDAQNFINNKDLICYCDGYKYEGKNIIWDDLSGQNNNLIFTNIPVTDNNKGSLNINNIKITGFSSNKMLNDKVTIMICVNKNINNMIEEETFNETFLLSIPGNDMYAFELQFINNYLYLIIDKTKIVSKHEVMIYNKSLLIFTYDGNMINIYLDGLNIISYKPRKLYFNNDKILINRNKNLNINLYSFLVYNRILSSKEILDLKDYFLTNSNKNVDSLDINKFQMNSNLSKIYDDYPIYKGYNKRDNLGNYDNNVFDNCNNNLKKLLMECREDCIEKCSTQTSFDNFEKCTNTCKNTIKSCKKLCKEDPNNKMYCKKTFDEQTLCPIVFKKDNKYNVYIPPNSIYATKNGFSGIQSYGENIDKAKERYIVNFPECKIPKELLKSNKNYLDNCPFIIHQANPCFTSPCYDVDWNKKDYKDLNLNNNCKKIISNYCHINYKLDDKCVCWDPKYKDNSKCKEFRSYFEEPSENCSPSQFKIEEHPDFNQYIKKNNIPCWGCKI